MMFQSDLPLITLVISVKCRKLEITNTKIFLSKRMFPFQALMGNGQGSQIMPGGNVLTWSKISPGRVIHTLFRSTWLQMYSSALRKARSL